MVTRLMIWLCLMVFHQIGTAQILTNSNLPIIVIVSDEEITDDGRVDANMKIYFKEDGGTNSLNDEPSHYDGAISIKLRGQTSLFLFDKKSYSFETVDVEGRDSTVNLLGMPKESDWVLHGPYSDKSLMRNALLYTMADEILAYAPRVQMVEMIVNDDYKGVYLFTEKIKRDDSRVDIARLRDEDIDGDEVTGGYILKFDKAEAEEVGWVSPYSISSDQPTSFILHYPTWDDIQTQQLNYIRNWITDFEDLLDSDDFNDPDNGYRKYISVESFIDHLLLNELSRNVDGYRLSNFMYKTKDREDDPGQLFMGPVWDYNIAFGNADYCRGSDIEGWAYDFNDVCPDDFWQIHFWWKRLLEDPEFQDRLKDKWMKLRNGKFSNANVNAWIDGFEEQLTGPHQRNFQRWPVLGEYVWPNNFVGNSFEDEVDYLREWLMDRLNWMDQEFDIELSVENEITGELKVSPNPSSDILKVGGIQWTGNTTFEVFGLDGKRYLTGQLQESGEVLIEQLPQGKFILKLSTGESHYSKKFVKI